ncbi:MAG: hypothetical protein ACYC1B_02210, partial [Thermoleophilia bacterium]
RMEADAPDIIVNRISDAVYPDIDVIGWRESVFRWLDRRTLSGKIIISLATLLAGIAYLIITLVCAAALTSSMGNYYSSHRPLDKKGI